MFRLQKKRKLKTKMKRQVNKCMRVNCWKALKKKKKKKPKLEKTYSPLSGGGRRRRRGFSLTALCPTGRRSIGRRPRSNELKLAGSRAYARTGTGRRWNAL